MPNGAPHETIATAAAEHVAARGHLALVDAYAVHLAAGGRGNAVYLMRAEEPALADALSWLDESLGRSATSLERLLYALEMRHAARVWTGEAAEDALRHGEVSIHLTGALRDDQSRDWGLSFSLPLGQVLPAAIERARAALAHANRSAA